MFSKTLCFSHCASDNLNNRIKIYNFYILFTFFQRAAKLFENLQKSICGKFFIHIQQQN